MHYPIDSWAGAALGTMVGNMVLGRAGVSPSFASLAYQADAAQNSDFFDHDLRDPGIAATHGLTAGALVSVGATPAFTWLWSKAVAEHQGA